jgi:hypothetical protein
MTTRCDFLTVSLGATTAAFAPRLAGAAGKGPKAIATVRESSFIKAFDDFFVKTLAPEYEKLTGIKVTYEPVSVGGMLTRLTTIAETKSGPEIAGVGLNWPHLFDKALVDVSDVAGEVGKKLGGWHELVQDVVVVNKKRKALPWGNIGQLEVIAPTGSRRRDHQVPGQLGGPPGRRTAPQEEGASVRLRDRSRLRRQPRLDVPAAVVVRRTRGGPRR